MEKSSYLKSYLCIDYPALIKNEFEAIRTLGGMQRLNQTFSRRNTKILLNFSPNNIFSKMLCSSQIDEIEGEPAKKKDFIDSLEKNNTENLSIINDVQNSSNNRSINLSYIPRQNDFLTMPCLLLSVKQKVTDPIYCDTKVIGKIKKVRIRSEIKIQKIYFFHLLLKY